MSARRSPWTRLQLLVAFSMYCRIPFGKLHKGNPEIIQKAAAIGRTPAALAMKLVNIASLDDAITTTGRKGLANASAQDRTMWAEMQSDWEQFAEESWKAELEVMGEQADEPLWFDRETPSGTDREVFATVRVGQSFFRQAILSAYDGKCCITALSLPTLLVASHIIPWRCNERHRLNPRNGLLLSVLHDKAFDAGLITINEDMTVRISPKHTRRDNDFMTTSVEAYEGRQICLPQKFGPDPEFLAYHRAHIFRQ